MLVMKFGGTSVATAERIRAVAGLVRASDEPVVVVTSALGGVTDALVEAAAAAERGEDAGAAVTLLRARHHEAALGVTEPGPGRERLLVDLGAGLDEAEELLGGIRQLRECPPRARDRLLSLGERLAAPLVAAGLAQAGTPAAAVDARECIVVDPDADGRPVDLDASEHRTRAAVAAVPAGTTPVFTGYIARTPRGQTTTLERGGSDYTATLVGAFLGAREIWIWTDVDGVMTADPRIVPEARVLPVLSYQEAAEMAYYGSKVLHPRTMIPAVQAGIPVRIRNTMRPEAAGTIIGPDADRSGPHGVKTVTAVRDLALVTVEGNGMIGVPGVVRRVFTAVADLGANVYLISQASSEHNITFAVGNAEGDAVVEALESEFATERARGAIDRIARRAPVGIVAIIGEGMRGTPGISERLFTAFGRARINVLAIAQGSSERNLSVVVDDHDVRRAVGAVHSRFGLTRDAHLLVWGKGLVGRALLRQIAKHGETMADDHGVRLKVVGVCGRTEALLEPAGLPNAQLEAVADGAALRTLGGVARPDDITLLDRLAESRWLDVIVVDATAAESADAQIAALERGCHVVTANKKPIAGSRAAVRRITAAAAEHGVQYNFEATFGAGLPLLATMRELRATGDQIRGVRGCLSGSLGFIGHALERGLAMSEAVREARELGYTEPDPRDDLLGTDLARKALIIARVLGHELEPEDVELPVVLPADLLAAPDVETFLARLPEADAAMAERVAEAARSDAVLRFVVEIDAAGARVRFGPVPRDSVLGQLTGPDNLLAFETERYHAQPLCIRGPGAGAEVTAAGVLGDILKIVRSA